MREIKIYDFAGAFAENKDVAREIRIKHITPFIEKKEELILNFEGVTGATQSFIHALISNVIREHGSECLEYINFKQCNETIKKIISIVVEYMQEGL